MFQPRVTALAVIAIALVADCTPQGDRDTGPADAVVDAAIADVIDAADDILDDALSSDAPVQMPPCQRSRPAGDAGADAGDASALRCNGSSALCDRRYNEVVYATAHNAMSNSDEGWRLPNQEHGISRALTDGIRGLMLDTHYDRGVAHLCHGQCFLGRKPLAEGLCEITQFLDTHPAEIVTIQFEPYVTVADLEAAMVHAGLLEYARAQPVGSPWPTLREMIGDGHRLVVFAENGGGSPAWYMPLFEHSFDTPYSFRTASDFNCSVNRGRASNSLFTVNHFLTNPVADRGLAEQVNHDPLLIDRARQCRTETGHLPNFIAVDFYNIGDVLTAVNTLNGL